MIKIFKYEIYNDCAKMPINAQILTIEMQGEITYVWAKVDTDNPSDYRHFVRYGTGWDIKSERALTYINSIFDGPFVWHWFEEIK